MTPEDAPTAPSLRSGRALWLRVFLDILALTMLTVFLDAFVVWKVYEDALSEQRTGVAGVVVSVLQGVVESLPPEIALVPAATRRRLGSLLKPFETKDLGLHSAVIFNEQGRSIFSVGSPPEVRPLSEDDDLRGALYNRTEVLSLDRNGDGPLLAEVLQITVPVRLQSGQRWALRVRMPLQEGQGVFSRLQRGIVGILAINMLLLGVVGYLLVSRRLVRPIERLANGVAGVGAGRLDVQLPVDREDEIGELSRSFNHMVNTLAQYRDSSEQQVASLEAANTQLVKTREQLIVSEKLASVGRLAAGVAHEVGNPLAAITGYMEILISDAQDELSRDLLVRVRREVTRIDGIVRELLDVARSPTGEQEAVELALLVPDLVAFLGVEPRFAGVRTQVTIPPGTPAVWVMEHKLRQVLINLLLNAADAAGPGGQVSIGAELTTAEQAAEAVEEDELFAPAALPPTGSFVAVHVSDTGPGISRQALSQIFEPFYTSKEPGEGTGLGLPVALRLVQGQGGFFTVAALEGVGARFTVHLPVAGGEA